ncbi:hypothetical protein FA743_19540 [Paracoccus gahaiensis]|uniref:Uncharacterized protein n=1 Tax=Paracoccus gahaiensis TaxID=1706839 RepID=A0A4U0RLT0_9RHOB|nr:hypothetical protein [Paracoccus gahaiensis]TJZ89014.1 hypothetical protein FA743_19540 [Paracoccus gahaiensis]
MIRQAIIVLTLLSASTALHASEVIHLRCEVQNQLDEQVETITINLGSAEGEAVHTSHTGMSTFYGIFINSPKSIIGYSQRHGKVSRLKVDRLTGTGRVDNLMTDEEKPGLWNEQAGSIGYPLDEVVWLGYDLNCQLAQPLF